MRAARRVPGAAPTPLRSVDAHLARAARRWAREHGYRISDRGRLSAIVLDAYDRGGRRAGDPRSPEALGGGDAL